MRIFLIGFMGSGKSHVGKRLAERTNLSFIDLDEWIETQQQRSIGAIFTTEGEAAFRQIEQHALYAMTNIDNAIIATGGGTPCFFDNMEWMNQHGITIYLETTADILLQRLLPQQSKRPLIKALNKEELYNFIQKKLAERAPFYEQAQVIYQIKTATENVTNHLFEQFSNIIGH